MAQLERICPNCGFSNPSDKQNCLQCGFDFLRLPAQKPVSPLVTSEQAATTALVIGATALIARVGVQLLLRAVFPRLVAGLKPRKSVQRTQSGDAADYIVKGWRTWNIHTGGDHSSGSEQFEWRIKRNKVPGR